MKSLLIALALAAGGQPPAAVDDRFCDDIRVLARGAGEAEPFRSLRDRNFTPRLGRARCFFSSAGGYTCGHTLARPEETRESYAARIHACLPRSVRSAGGESTRGYELVRRGRFEARISESGTDRAHVGRSITIFIGSAAAPKAQVAARPQAS